MGNNAHAVTPSATLSSIFNRQQALPLFLPHHVALIGCGGVGSWVGYFLALAGVRCLDLFDQDSLEAHNLNRMPYSIECVKLAKTEALRTLIKKSRPNAIVIEHEAFTKSYRFGKHKPEWVVVSTDTLASRRMVHQWAVKHKVNYLEAAAEGEFGSIATSPAEWSTPAEANPGYAHVPVWVGPAVSAAMMACTYMLHRHQLVEAARFGFSDGKLMFAQHEGNGG